MAPVPSWGAEGQGDRVVHGVGAEAGSTSWWAGGGGGSDMPDVRTGAGGVVAIGSLRQRTRAPLTAFGFGNAGGRWG